MKRFLQILIPTALVVVAFLWLVQRFFSPQLATLVISPFLSPEDLGWHAQAKVETDVAPFLDEVCKVPYAELDGKHRKFILTVKEKEYLCTFHIDDTFWSGGSWGNDLKMFEGIVTNRVTNQKDVARKIVIEIEPHVSPDADEESKDVEKQEFYYAAVPSEEWYVLIPFDEYEKQELALEEYQKEQANAAEKAKKRQKEKEKDDSIPRAN